MPANGAEDPDHHMPGGPAATGIRTHGIGELGIVLMKLLFKLLKQLLFVLRERHHDLL